MPTTIDTYLPFDTGPGANVSETGWRDMMKHMTGSASGVIRGFDSDFDTIGDSSGMQVKTSSGQCWMRGHYGRNASQRTLAIATAHATLARKDAVIIRADFVNNRIELDVKTGTAAASPVLPTMTQNTSVWETLLAEVNVAAAAATITAANVLDRRVYTTVFAKYLKNNTVSTTSGSTIDLVFTDTVTASGDVIPNSTSTPTTFTLARAGLWQITAQAEWGVNGSNGRHILITNSAGTTIYGQTNLAPPGSSTNANAQCQANEYFAANSVVKVQVRQTSGSNLNIIGGACHVCFMWIGP